MENVRVSGIPSSGGGARPARSVVVRLPDTTPTQPRRRRLAFHGLPINSGAIKFHGKIN